MSSHPRPSPRRIRRFGAASIALGVLGTAAQAIGNIQKIQTFVTDVIGSKAFKNLHLALTAVVVAALILAYAAATYWIYLKLQSRDIRIRIAVMALALVLLSGLAVGSYALIPPPPDPDAYRAEKAKEWRDRLLAHPAEDGGVKVSFSEAQAPTQVWTTAQALRAVLVSSVDADLKRLAARLRSAFDFIEDSQIRAAPGGWGYFKEWQTGVTEIAGWVCVAEAASVDATRRDIVWAPEQVSRIFDRITHVVQLIVSTQQHDGGWGPTAQRGADLSRTYSTTLATWCLIEAHRTGGTPLIPDSTYDRAITDGITWLLTNYRQSLGWVPNPHRKIQNERFLGLTAQVLYVLEQAQTSEHFKSVATGPNALPAKKEFLAAPDFGSRSLGDNDRLHDSDRYLRIVSPPVSTPASCTCPPFTIEASTFLWYPWSLAAVRSLAFDQTIEATQRAAAENLSRALTGRLSEASELIDTGFNYIVAEFLIGVSENRPPNASRDRGKT